MGLELVYPELKSHINYVFKIQNRTYWAARRYAKSLFIKKRFIEQCTFCRAIAPETIKHMLLECIQWQALRADILAQYINIYRAQVATKPPLLPALISMRLVGKLLGEELKLSSTEIRKDPTALCVKTTLATAKFLNSIALPRYLTLNGIRLLPIPRTNSHWLSWLERGANNAKVTGSTPVRSILSDSIVVSIPVCHIGDPGSIPGPRVAFLAQLAERLPKSQKSYKSEKNSKILITKTRNIIIKQRKMLVKNNADLMPLYTELKASLVK
ncbi:hypothetical protein BB561_005151 [Smittium simulii]|uniref:Uncharacterized protein n=1 Tax=Smittium simulii TaxID=133385 RepID=A0A2T9YBW7_9FUNG|nr:hypothetical protein BB561_005151 [Smittium simulii]